MKCRTSYALVSQYGEGDTALLHQSHGTLHVAHYHGKHALRVIDARCIRSLIAMLPFVLSAAEAQDNSIKSKYSQCFFVAEKPFINFTTDSIMTYESDYNGNEEDTMDNGNSEEMDNIVESECNDDGDDSEDERDGSEDERDGSEDEGNGIDCEEESSGY
jgi:hypothetical protein